MLVLQLTKMLILRTCSGTASVVLLVCVCDGTLLSQQVRLRPFPSCEYAAGSSAMEEEDSDIEWMDSEPGPSVSIPPDDSFIRAESSIGAAALKPPLPPGPSRQPSARPPSYPNSGRTQQKAQVADLRLQHASTIGRHQAAADAVSERGNQNPELPLGQPSIPGSSVPLSPKKHQGLDSPPSQHHASTQSPGQQPGPQQQSPAHGSKSPQKQPIQPASPFTSPFKKVPSPWERDQEAAPKGSSMGAPHQISLPSAPKLGKSPLLGKRTHSDAVVEHGGIKQLQHIIARADDIAQDQTRDSVLLDTLNDVPDDQAMPFSIEDRGAGISDTAADNMKGISPPKAAQQEILGRRETPQKAASQDSQGRLGSTQQASLNEAEGRLGSALQSISADAIKPVLKPTGSEGIIDMTAHDLPSSSQPVSFDDIDEGFDADLIAAVDKSSAEHTSGGLQQTASAGMAANAAAAPKRGASGQQQHPADSHAANVMHHDQQQQQLHIQQQQEQESSARQSVGVSMGMNGSLPAPSEVGLGEYGSAALEGGPSMGVSTTLPSFDLDAEMDSLDKQTKVTCAQSACHVSLHLSQFAQGLSACQWGAILVQPTGVCTFCCTGRCDE